MQLNAKIGIVSRVDNSGLGVMGLDFFRNIPFSKVLSIPGRYNDDLSRFDGYEGVENIICAMGAPTLPEIHRFLDGLDVVVAIETPYNWALFSEAKKRGIKTALIVMYEWTPLKAEMPFEPDLYICPTKLDYDEMWEPKVLIPTPVNRVLVPWKERTEAKTFIFNNGHGGVQNRNSLVEFFQAISLVKSDVKFIVRSQVAFEPFNDRRVEIVGGDLPYEQLWSDGDVYIHLHKWDGLSLPLQEACSAGLPTIALDYGPYAEVLPKELLVKPMGEITVQLGRPTKGALVDPRAVAAKIDEIAGKPISELSKRMDGIAETFSWKTLKPAYIEAFNKLAAK